MMIIVIFWALPLGASAVLHAQYVIQIQNIRAGDILLPIQINLSTYIRMYICMHVRRILTLTGYIKSSLVDWSLARFSWNCSLS